MWQAVRKENNDKKLRTRKIRISGREGNPPHTHSSLLDKEIFKNPGRRARNPTHTFLILRNPGRRKGAPARIPYCWNKELFRNPGRRVSETQGGGIVKTCDKGLCIREIGILGGGIAILYI